MIDIDTVILNNIHLITGETLELNNTIKILISTLKAKNSIKETIGVEAFKIYKDEILFKLFKHRKRIYNELYYQLKTAKIKIEDRVCLNTSINNTKMEAKLAGGGMLNWRDWDVMGVLTYSDPKTEFNVTMDFYHLKKFLIKEGLVNDVFCNTECEANYHLHVLFTPAPGKTNNELIQSITNYWNKYHGLCKLEAVDKKRDYKRYWTKAMFSKSHRLRGNFWDIDFDLWHYSEKEDVINHTEVPSSLLLRIRESKIQQILSGKVDVNTACEDAHPNQEDELKKPALSIYFAAILLLFLNLIALIAQ